jgi:hypothetical protein
MPGWAALAYHANMRQLLQARNQSVPTIASSRRTRLPEFVVFVLHLQHSLGHVVQIGCVQTAPKRAGSSTSVGDALLIGMMPSPGLMGL